MACTVEAHVWTSLTHFSEDGLNDGFFKILDTYDWRMCKSERDSIVGCPVFDELWLSANTWRRRRGKEGRRSSCAHGTCA